MLYFVLLPNNQMVVHLEEVSTSCFQESSLNPGDATLILTKRKQRRRSAWLDNRHPTETKQVWARSSRHGQKPGNHACLLITRVHPTFSTMKIFVCMISDEYDIARYEIRRNLGNYYNIYWKIEHNLLPNHPGQVNSALQNLTTSLLGTSR